MDDSSKEDVKEKIDERVAYWQSRGWDCSLHRRRGRQGFKAGSMLAHHGAVKGKHIAIFDSDFVPYTDFLLRTVRHSTSSISPTSYTPHSLLPTSHLLYPLYILRPTSYLKPHG